MSVRNGWWKEILAIIDEKSLLKHPFYQAWTQGKLTRGDLAHYAKQYYRQEANFPRFVSAVHSNCPELPIRQALLENLNDEEFGPENHPELWLRFGEAVGASRGAMAKAPVADKTRACVDAFENLTADKNWAKGLAALYAYEAQQPAVAKTKIEGLKKWYGLVDKRALGFFEVHQDVDAWHSETERRILLDQAAKNPGLKEEMKEAVSAACDALNGLLTGVCEARDIACSH